MSTHEIIDDLVVTGWTIIDYAELLTEYLNVKKSYISILSVIDLPNLGSSKLIIDQDYNIEKISFLLG